MRIFLLKENEFGHVGIAGIIDMDADRSYSGAVPDRRYVDASDLGRIVGRFILLDLGREIEMGFGSVKGSDIRSEDISTPRELWHQGGEVYENSGAVDRDQPHRRIACRGIRVGEGSDSGVVYRLQSAENYILTVLAIFDVVRKRIGHEQACARFDLVFLQIAFHSKTHKGGIALFLILEVGRLSAVACECHDILEDRKSRTVM